MEEAFICYKTDNWHSYNSRDLIGVATDMGEALCLCQLQAQKEGFTLSHDEDLPFLKENNQTQGYKGEGEFVIEPVDTNVLL